MMIEQIFHEFWPFSNNPRRSGFHFTVFQLSHRKLIVADFHGPEAFAYHFQLLGKDFLFVVPAHSNYTFRAAASDK